MTIRRQALGVTLVLLAAACTESTAPIEARATVVVPDTLVTSQMISSSAQWIQFNLPVSIRNTASVPLTFTFCASSIEVRDGGTWTRVWSPICALTNSSPTPIAPGETRVMALSIVGAVSGNGGPTWDNPTVVGTYRLTAALLPEGFSGTVPTISSNAFTLLRGM